MAARFWIGGGTNTNWNASPTTNWAATSGGTTRVAAPTVSDDVTFDGVGTNANTASVISATQSVLSLSFTTGYTNTVTVNAGLTIAGNFTDRTNHTWAGASGLALSATCTITSNGKTWPNAVTMSGTTTKTLSGNWSITGSLSITGAITLNATTAETLTVAGGLSMQNIMTAGTAKIILTGGTWSSNANDQLINNLDIQGNVTISGNVYFNTKTLTYVSGTVTTTGSTLNIAGSCTLNTNGISWESITANANATTLTINSLLTVTGTFLSSGVTLTFAGTTGFSVATFSCNLISASVLTFANTVTYTITTSLLCSSSRLASIVSFTSDHATNKAIITLNNGAACNCFASFTRIDASNGRAIYAYNGTITTCNNVFSFTDALTPASQRLVKAGAIY